MPESTTTGTSYTYYSGAPSTRAEPIFEEDPDSFIEVHASQIVQRDDHTKPCHMNWGEYDSDRMRCGWKGLPKVPISHVLKTVLGACYGCDHCRLYASIDVVQDGDNVKQHIRPVFYCSDHNFHTGSNEIPLDMDNRVRGCDSRKPVTGIEV